VTEMRDIFTINAGISRNLFPDQPSGCVSPERGLIKLLRSNLPITQDVRVALALLLERGANPLPVGDNGIYLKFHNNKGKASLRALIETRLHWLKVYRHYKSVLRVKGGATAACADKFNIGRNHIEKEILPFGRAFDKWSVDGKFFGGQWPIDSEERYRYAAYSFASKSAQAAFGEQSRGG